MAVQYWYRYLNIYVPPFQIENRASRLRDRAAELEGRPGRNLKNGMRTFVNLALTVLLAPHREL